MKNNLKKILLFVDWFLPGYKGGGPIQSCRNFVEAFRHDFEIFVVTSDRDLGDEVPYPGIAVNSWIRLSETVQVYYAPLQDVTRKGIKELLATVQPDYLYLNSMFSFRLTILPLLVRMPENGACQVVLAPRGMLHEGALQYKHTKKALFIRLLNFLRIPRRLVFHATDEQEERDIRRYFPHARKVFVAPNFPTAEVVPWTPVLKESGTLRCIFLSRLSPKKNLLYFLQVLLQLPEELRIHFSIFGEIEDQPYWTKCQEVITQLPPSVQVTWHGPVNNQDIFRVYRDYHVFVLPTHGENFGHAIFEALLAGKPVIISDKTPWRHLQAPKAGFDISLDNIAGYRQAVEQFARMPQEEYDTWSQAAAGFARAYRENNPIKEQYAGVFAS